MARKTRTPAGQEVAPIKGGAGLAGGGETKIMLRRHFDYLAWQLELSEAGLAEIAVVSPEQLRLWESDAAGLLSRESIAMLSRLSVALARASTLFDGSTEKAAHWLRRNACGLAFRKPLDVAAAEDGLTEVTNLISRLEHGIYT